MRSRVNVACVVATLMFHSVAVGQAPAESSMPSVRRELLLHHLHREQEIIDTWWPRAVWGAGLLTGAAIFATQSPSTLSGYDEWAEEQMDTWRVPTTVLLGALGGLEGASFFLDEPVQWALNDFQFSILYLGFGAAMLGAWGHNGTTRLTTGAVFGTGVALGALELVELSTRQSARLRFGAVGDQLAGWDERQGEDGLAQAESVLRDGSHPYWHYLCIGGIVAGGAMVAITPALVDSTNQREKETAESVGAVMSIHAALYLTILGLGGTSYSRYVDALEEVRLVPLGPEGTSGATLDFRF